LLAYNIFLLLINKSIVIIVCLARFCTIYYAWVWPISIYECETASGGGGGGGGGGARPSLATTDTRRPLAS